MKQVIKKLALPLILSVGLSTNVYASKPESYDLQVALMKYVVAYQAYVKAKYSTDPAERNSATSLGKFYKSCYAKYQQLLREKDLYHPENKKEKNDPAGNFNNKASKPETFITIHTQKIEEVADKVLDVVADIVGEPSNSRPSDIDVASTKIEDTAENTAEGETERQVESQTENQVEQTVDNEVDNQIENKVEQTVDSEVEAQVEKEVEKQVEEQVEQEVDKTVEDMVKEEYDKEVEKVEAESTNTDTSTGNGDNNGKDVGQYTSDGDKRLNNNEKRINEATHIYTADPD